MTPFKMLCLMIAFSIALGLTVFLFVWGLLSIINPQQEETKSEQFNVSGQCPHASQSRK